MKKIKSYVKNYLKEVDENGFSLLELVVAVGILLILTVGGLVAYSKITENSRNAAVQSAVDETMTGAMAYEVDNMSKTMAEDAEIEWNGSSKKDKDGKASVAVDVYFEQNCLTVAASHVNGKNKAIKQSGTDCVNNGGNGGVDDPRWDDPNLNLNIPTVDNPTANPEENNRPGSGENTNPGGGGDDTEITPVEMTCKERDLLDQSTWWALRFYYNGENISDNDEFRAYLKNGDKTYILESSEATFTVSQNEVKIQIDEEVLRTFTGDVRNGNSVNGEVILEKKRFNGSWVSVAEGKFAVYGKLTTDEAECG